MNYKAISKVLGIFLMLFSTSMLIPIMIDFIYQEQMGFEFLLPFFLTLGTGASAWYLGHRSTQELKTRDGFLTVALFWLVLSVFGAIPFMLMHHPVLSFTDALFESMSGLTTTGATIIKNIDQLPHAVLFYRQELEFLGGMGIIVLAVAVLPMLGMAGLQLYRAEISGLMKETKLTPRITETAKTLWIIYVGLTVSCAISYWLSGMSVFDAMGESFSTVSTGGFNMHDASFTYYNNTKIDLCAIFFMILGGTNFSLHFFAFKKRSIIVYWRDSEFRAYFLILAIVSVVTCGVLFYNHVYQRPGVSLVNSIFDTVSMATTTGSISGAFSTWPSFIPVLLMLIALIGGCSGSTSGGIKVVRFLLFYKQGAREIQRLIHPQSVIPIKLDQQVVTDRVLEGVWGFIALFAVIFIVLLLALIATGLDLESAFGTLVACLSNAGAGIGKILASGNFSELNNHSKWLLTFAMLAGRLEIFTLVLLFAPSFWRY